LNLAPSLRVAHHQPPGHRCGLRMEMVRTNRSRCVIVTGGRTSGWFAGKSPSFWVPPATTAAPGSRAVLPPHAAIQADLRSAPVLGPLPEVAHPWKGRVTVWRSPPGDLCPEPFAFEESASPAASVSMSVQTGSLVTRELQAHPYRIACVGGLWHIATWKPTLRPAGLNPSKIKSASGPDDDVIVIVPMPAPDRAEHGSK